MTPAPSASSSDGLPSSAHVHSSSPFNSESRRCQAYSPGNSTLQVISIKIAPTVRFPEFFGLLQEYIYLYLNLNSSDVRAVCKSLSRAFTCVLLVLCLKLYPVLESRLGLQACFYLFSVIMVLSLPVVYLVLPETKDVGLEMIQHYFLPAKTIFYVSEDFFDDDRRPKSDGQTDRQETKMISA